MQPNLTSEWLLVDKLNAVARHLKSTFVGKDDIIDLMSICLVGRENLFMLGPPGTAKSALVRELARLVQGRTFEYLLTRFTEPNELFGPFDIRKLREGELVTNTEGLLPEANLIFLDELLNANSAILNSLLLVLNERVFRRGRETRALPALMIVGASNHLPEEEALQALFDRFLVRVHCDYVAPDQLAEVLEAGWTLERKTAAEAPTITAEEILQLQQAIPAVDLQAVRPAYVTLIGQLRNAGVPVSDRRAVKLQRLLAASALLCQRTVATPSDMWVLRYSWDTDEQREVIAGIVDAVVAADEEPGRHPRAAGSTLPDADALLQEVTALGIQWDQPETSLAERTAIKDQLRYLNGRCQWIGSEVQRAYVQQPLDALWQKVLQA
ncbi:AAA family ATPase [Hymenobacter sp. HSC-4F20]|uniref:AAA family ATPase n=1 Tax=Hymenobacter sp. HSC-4F20 TaxID=2864135 RepID=UPI001C73DAD2|nr:AAA family ATPase [Hymenobacter sp. HSC-4F20]MBX0290706.1 AAA family ATPase [Hymenobacter sp. HSC-4F20]